MYFEIKSYLNFLLKSQNQHGLHSPFVYDLVTKCFYDKKFYPEYKVIQEYRNDLLQDRNLIEVNDFGAGSKVFKSNKRPVFAIAKNSGITLHRAKILFRLVKYLECKNVLELGTSLGIATSAMALNKKADIISIEGCKETAKIAREKFNKFQLNNIELKIENFEDSLNELLNDDTKFDLIFFDGNHQKEPTLYYFEKLLPHAHNDSVFIFDDIYWSKKMKEAWIQIKKHPSVQISIDTYSWGMIFFRKQQAKQHFKIRM